MAEPAALGRGSAGGKPWGEAIHATAVSIAGAGLLILGASGSGKSRLAATLIGTSRGAIRLVGDDRILLTLSGHRLLARPHPRIAGFIERRGFGIVACPFVAAACVHGIVRLDLGREARDARPKTLSTALAQNFFALPAVDIGTAQPLSTQCDAVLSWWRDACTRPASKTPPNAAAGTEVWNW